MPKTKDAFAFRKVDIPIPDYFFNRYFWHKMLIKSPELVYSYDDYHFDDINEILGKDKVIQEKTVRVFIYEILQHEYSFQRCEFLIKRVEYHLLRRLTPLLAENLSDEKVMRLKYLIGAYSKLLKHFNGKQAQFENFLQDAQKRFKDFLPTELGKRLRIARKAAGYTGVEMSQFLNIRPNSYVDYELGRTAPPLSTLCLLAKKYNVTTDYLLCLSD